MTTTQEYLKAARVGKLLDKIHYHKLNNPQDSRETMETKGVATMHYLYRYYAIRNQFDFYVDILAEIQRQYPHKTEDQK